MIEEPGGGEVFRVAATAVALDASEQERRQAGWVLGVSTTLLVALSAAGMAVAGGAACMLAVVPAIAMIYGFGALAVAGLGGRPSAAPGVVSVADGVLHVSIPSRRFTRAIPLADVAQGHREPPDLVYLTTREGESFVVRVPDEAEADRLLGACGVRAAERALRVPLASAAARLPGGRLLASAVLASCFLALLLGALLVGFFLGRSELVADGERLAGLLGTAALLLPPALLGYAAVRALARRQVIVGVDGLAFRGALRRRVIPFAAVSRVLRDRRGVRVELRSGRDLVLPTVRGGRSWLSTVPPPDGLVSEAEAQRNALHDRIVAAMALRDAADPDRSGLDRLDRAGRPLAAWREALGRLVAEGADYRQATLTRADLADVIGDAAAPAERRIAAAVALSAKANDEARARVRVAAQACADDDLRRALEAAAEGEIDEAALARHQRRA
jgi:hypothetical protein